MGAMDRHRPPHQRSAMCCMCVLAYSFLGKRASVSVIFSEFPCAPEGI